MLLSAITSSIIHCFTYQILKHIYKIVSLLGVNMLVNLEKFCCWTNWILELSHLLDWSNLSKTCLVALELSVNRILPRLRCILICTQHENIHGYLQMWRIHYRSFSELPFDYIISFNYFWISGSSLLTEKLVLLLCKFSGLFSRSNRGLIWCNMLIWPLLKDKTYLPLLNSELFN